MPTSQRIKGHTLVAEGDPHDRFGIPTWTYGGPVTGSGRCRCGVQSEPLPTTAARKRWHREHKAEVLARVE